MADKIKTIGVVGTGVIGSSWTALFLAHGFHVIVADPAPNAEKDLKDHLEKFWPTLEQLGLKDNASIKNYKFIGSSIAAHGQELDFVQENAPERVDLKIKIIAEIAESTRSDVVIASSSSGLPSSQFVDKCKNPERVLIGHPFNPPHLMPLVEVVPHPKTSEDAKQTALDFYRNCGKAAVLEKQETPGFAANRLQAALCAEAYSLVQRGILTAEDVDLCVTTSLGPRYATVGPLMANALGGGEGGFKHFSEHLLPATQVWLKDMRAHEFQFRPEDVDALNASVQDMVKRMPTDQVIKYRDALTIELLKLKQKS